MVTLTTQQRDKLLHLARVLEARPPDLFTRNYVIAALRELVITSAPVRAIDSAIITAERVA
jgi:hypothetical protein